MSAAVRQRLPAGGRPINQKCSGLLHHLGEPELHPRLKFAHGYLVGPELVEGRHGPQWVEVLGQQEGPGLHYPWFPEHQQLPVFRGQSHATVHTVIAT